MAGKRAKPEEMVAKLRQVGVLQGQSQSIADAVRQIGVTQQTYYQWRQHYNRKRPHSALGWWPPAPEVVMTLEQRPVIH